MARKSFMSDFQDDHVIAFDNNFGQSMTTSNTKSSGSTAAPAIETLPTFHGLPQEGTYGWYSTRLGYKEWHYIACARKAYEEVQGETPSVIF